MWGPLQHWFHQIPYHDALERRQALLLQATEIGLLIAVLLGLPLPFFAPMAQAGQLTVAALIAAAGLAALLALGLLRAGRAQLSAMLLAGMLAALFSALLYGTTLEDGAVPMFAFALPIALGGLMAGRRGLRLALGLSLAGVALALALVRLGAPGAGFARSEADASFAVVLSFALMAGLFGLFIDNLRSLIEEALADRRGRERELEALSRRLEASVRERTADLEMALNSLEQRAAEQQRLLAENQRQQALIRDLSVPVLPLNATTAVMPLVGLLDAERIVMLQAQALAAIERLRARYLLLDITGVPLVDSHVAAGLIQTLQAARLLGAEVVLVGVRPEVAQAVVGLGIDLQTMRFYADLQTALSSLPVTAR